VRLGNARDEGQSKANARRPSGQPAGKGATEDLVPVFERDAWPEVVHLGHGTRPSALAADVIVGAELEARDAVDLLGAALRPGDAPYGTRSSLMNKR